MSKKPLGKQTDSIFNRDSTSLGSTATAEKRPLPLPDTDNIKRERGRPTKQPSVKTTVVLNIDQLFWLDSLSNNIRRATGRVVARSELLRAFASAIEESGIELSDANSEEVVKNTLLKRLTNAN